jgi:hypothetical protein
LFRQKSRWWYLVVVVVDVVVVDVVVDVVVVDVVVVDVVVVVVDVEVLLLCCPTCSFSPCPFLVDLENKLEPLQGSSLFSRERERERDESGTWRTWS